VLKQLPVPEKPWNSISMDFIEQLPSSTSFLNKPYSSLLMTPSLAWSSQSSSYSMCSPSMVFLPMSPQIAVPSSSCTSSGRLERLSTCASTSPPVTTQRAMARLNALTRPLNSTSRSTATTSRTTGRTYSHWRSSRTTTHLVLPPECHPSSLTRATTLASPFTQNMI